MELISAARMEYDGLTKYELELRPVAAEAQVERLSLQIPLKAEYAQLYHVLGPNTGLRDPRVAGALAPGEGVVWSSQADAPFLAQKNRGVNWPCQVWLGGMVRGLVWYADNDKGWVSGTNQPAATVTRSGEVVTLALHFINGPFTLKGPRRIAYCLLATPPKPLPKDYRLWNRGHLDTAGKVGGRLTSCDSFAPWIVPCRAETFAYWPPDDHWDLVRLATARQRQGDGGKYPPGQALMMYHDKNKTPLHPAMLPYYGWSWGACRYPQSRINHLVWYMDKMIDCGYDGVYIDDVFPFGSWNLEPLGSAYSVEKGDGTQGKQVGSEAGEYRDYTKRLYGLFAARGKAPLITTHMTSTLGWPYHAFATVAFDHEQAERFKDPTGTFMDAWPLDYLMTMDIAERSGLVTVPMLKGKYLEKRTPLQVWAAERSFQAVWMLFDLNLPLDRTVLAPYYGTDVEVLPFWRNSHIVSLTPLIQGEAPEKDLPLPTWWKTPHFRRAIGAQPLRATLYKKGNRCLLVVANFLRRAVGCRAVVAFDALGVPADVRERLTATDVDRDRPPAGADLAALHLSGNQPKREPVHDATGDAELSAFLHGTAGGRGTPGAERFYAVARDGRAISLQIGAHNYRAIELRW
jgi:hypothetical protein